MNVFDADDHHQTAEGVSEYDSLIADLKGGIERRRAGEDDRGSSGQRKEPRQRRRERRGHRDRDAGERPAVAERGYEKNQTPPAEQDSPVSEPAEADAPSTAYGESDTDREPAFGVGVAEPEERESAFDVGVAKPEEREPVSAHAVEVEPAAREPVRPIEPAVEPPPPDEKQEEEETEFGAGIL